jgi:hypothetical protein
MANSRNLFKCALASVWLLTAIASFAYPLAANLELLARVGITGNIAQSVLYTGIALDALIGILTLLNGKWQKWLWLLQAGIILIYSLIIVIYLPDLALHPFGILIKNIPILAILWQLWRSETKEKPHAL